MTAAEGWVSDEAWDYDYDYSSSCILHHLHLHIYPPYHPTLPLTVGSSAVMH